MKPCQIIKFQDGDFVLDVNVSPEEETVWLTKDEIAFLFCRDRTVISRHISNIFRENELDKNISCAKNARQVAGQIHHTTFYNLDVIISVGYRVKSQRGITFRKWATNVLRQYVIKGYAIAETRCLECKNSILELQVKYLELEAKQNSSILFEPGDQLKAFLGVQKFLESAKSEILIIDNYFGHAFDEILYGLNVEKIIITNVNNTKVETCENYKVIKNNIFHDRFIIVDNYCYHFGASIEDVGKNISVGQRINEIEIVKFLKSFKKEN